MVRLAQIYGLLFGVVRSSFTPIDVEAEAKALNGAWLGMKEMFDSVIGSNVHGTQDDFPAKWTVDNVLNPYNKIYAKEIISSLSLPSQQRLFRLCNRALFEQFRLHWVRVRNQLEELTELYSVPSPRLIQPLRERRKHLTQLLTVSSEKSNANQHLFNEYQNLLVAELEDLVKRPWEAGLEEVKRTYRLVDAYLEEARTENYNNAAIVEMLRNAEDRILRSAKVELPESFAEDFAYIEEQLGVVERCLADLAEQEKQEAEIARMFASSSS